LLLRTKNSVVTCLNGTVNSSFVRHKKIGNPALDINTPEPLLHRCSTS
jgi:hypothetical protein